MTSCFVERWNLPTRRFANSAATLFFGYGLEMEKTNGITWPSTKAPASHILDVSKTPICESIEYSQNELHEIDHDVIRARIDELADDMRMLGAFSLLGTALIVIYVLAGVLYR